MTTSAPPDLARLIETYTDAVTAAERIAAHYDLLRWPGWKERRRVVYTHGGTRIALVWGSLKIGDHPVPHRS